MVDAQKQGDSVAKLLQWLGTFKGFHNKLELKAADGESPRASGMRLLPGDKLLIRPRCRTWSLRLLACH